MRRWTLPFAAAVATLLFTSLRAAEPTHAQRPIDVRDKRDFRSGSELVTTAVTVRDQEGRLITNLTAADFIVEEDGIAQPITQFSTERVPVSLSLVMDVSDSMRGQHIEDARTALAIFLERLLVAPDEASLIAFNHDARVLASWTQDRAGLKSRLDTIRPSGGTAMYDAIDAALPQFEFREHPRAAILLVSDGADTASDITPTRLKQKLARSDVFLYAIGIDAPSARASTRINEYTLGELTSQVGGYTEVIHAASELGAATERIAQELNSQYMLGYTPIARGNGQYHSLRVKVTHDQYRVRSRHGVVR